MKPKKLLQEAKEYLIFLVEELHLTGWGFDITIAPEMDDAHACVYSKAEFRDFSIELGPSFFKLDDEDRREVLLHEVLHVTQGWMRAVVEEQLIPSLPKSQRKQAAQAWRTAMEQQCHHLSRALTGRFC